jgi:hypothetical protein
MGEIPAAFAALVAASLGTAIGAISAALIRARSIRAEGAGALVQAASQLTDRLLARNTDLSEELHTMRLILDELDEAVVDLLYEMPHPSDSTLDRLREAHHKAQEI